MNYMDEINAFIDWLEINPLDAGAQALWFHLMAICHKSGSPDWFTVANLTLQAKLGVTDKTLAKHRNTLINKGRIAYKNQGKRKAGKYRIIPFNQESQEFGNQADNVFDYYQRYISPVISPTIAEEIGLWVDDLSEEIVIKAMDIALERNIRNWSYISGILRDWANRGLTTIEQIEADQMRFRGKKQRGDSGAQHSGGTQGDDLKYNYGF